MDHFLQMKNVSKTFGEVAALHDVNFEVGTNEIVGLLGDNGAGKSTLVKIITGYHQPDPGGEFYLKGKKVDHLSVARARDLGIEVVYQERALADKQSLWRNIFMGRELSNGMGRLDLHDHEGRDAKAHAHAHGIHLLRHHRRSPRSRTSPAASAREWPSPGRCTSRRS